ncbi:MAG: ATP-dependent zinc metalloprotease FtsH [Anaplasma sp.]
MNFRKVVEGLIVWSAVIALTTILYTQFGDRIIGSKELRIPFSEFLVRLDAGEVERANITEREISGKLRDGTKFRTGGVIYDSLIRTMHEHKVTFEFSSGETLLGILGSLLISCLPMLSLVVIWCIFLKQIQVGGNRTMSFSKSRARLMTDNRGKVTFEDVAGIDEAKEELVEIVDFLKHRHKFQKLGGKIPKGCLLIGPPGTGKTLLARAIAGEASVPFFSISGSDFVEMFVGVGASRVRDMFEQGKKHAPCIIFVDEIDAVGRHRGIGLGGGNDEREQTLNQLLVEMDGFESNEGVIIIAATNRPDVLDPALLRPGRFDRQVTISIPDINGREKIINVHSKKVPMAPDVDIRVVARGTPGFSGADLANLVNEAALIAARLNKKIVTMSDFEYARDKVMMGAERRSLMMTDEERRLTAYHEAGHAVVAFHNQASDPIHKATIIPRGRTLGLVMRLPESDRVSHTREKMLADLMVAMGGRAAEELVFGYSKVTSGASSDIRQATELARSMVMKWGMSDSVGPLYHNDDRNEQISNDMANLIDSEVKVIVSRALEEAKSLLNKHTDSLRVIAENLLEFETLTGEEIGILMSGKELSKEDGCNIRPTKRSFVPD